MINNNVEVMSDPEPGEDLETHLDIYYKCLDTKSRKSILDKYNKALIKKKELMPTMPQGADGQGANLAQNLMMQQSNPNTQPV